MGHGHGHGHGHGPSTGSAGEGASAAGKHRRPLLIAFCMTFSFMFVEVATGLFTGSLALLSDAAHMGTDVIGLGMALAAISLAPRPATSQRTYGAYRLEVLAALANGILLFAVAGYVLYEAYRRINGPVEIPGLPLLVVACIGLIVNVISFRLLQAGSTESLNLRGAYLEVVGDMLGSIGVIAAAGVIFATGWSQVDPLIGVGIGLFILPRTWNLVRQALRILMEIAPEGMDVGQVRDRLLELAGVADVHDLHIWTLTSGLETATGHIVLASGAELHDVLDRVLALLRDEYNVTHATIQCEPEDHEDHANPI